MAAEVGDIASISAVLMCPDCGNDLVVISATTIQCLNCRSVFPVAYGAPILQPKAGQVMQQIVDPLKPASRSHHTTITSRFVSAVFRLWRMTPFYPHAAEHYRANRALRQLLSGVQGLVLEVGCGEQSAASFIDRKNTVYIPTDYIGWGEAVNEDSYGHRGFLVPLWARRPLFWADCLHLPIKSETLDAWIAIEVLEHLPSSRIALEETSRCLKPGGHAFISVPWLMRVHGGTNDEGDYGRYTRLALETMANQCGMDMVKFSVNTSVWTTTAYLISGYFIRIILEHVPTRLLKILCGALVTPVFVLMNLLSFTFDGSGDRRFALHYYVILEKRAK